MRVRAHCSGLYTQTHKNKRAQLSLMPFVGKWSGEEKTIAGVEKTAGVFSPLSPHPRVQLHNRLFYLQGTKVKTSGSKIPQRCDGA